MFLKIQQFQKQNFREIVTTKSVHTCLSFPKLSDFGNSSKIDRDMYIQHAHSFCDVSDRSVGTSQKDCACAVTRLVKLLFLTSDYCMRENILTKKCALSKTVDILEIAPKLTRYVHLKVDRKRKKAETS